MRLSDTTAVRLRATIVAAAPMFLLAAFAWHPYIPGRLPNNAAVGRVVAPDTMRWGFSHLAAGVAFGMAVLAFIAIRSYLRETSNDAWSALGLPFVVMGSALYTMLPGMEFTPLAAVESGGDAEAVQAALQPWFVPILMVGGVTFVLGSLCFAVGIARSGVLSPGPAGIVITALVVMAASRLVPLVVGQLYLQGLAAAVALWPLAYQMWKRSHRRPAGQPRATAADLVR